MKNMAHNGRPICVKCKLFYRPKENGVHWEEGMPVSKGVWVSYKLYQADLWQCSGCDTEVIVGHGQQIREHFENDYATVRALLKPMLRVDDC